VHNKKNPKISSADLTQKLKNNLKMHTYKDLGEEKGKMPEIKAVEQDGEVKVTIQSKDGKTLSTAASMDTQKNGTFEESAKKAGAKKEDVTMTAASMAAAQADLSQKKDLDNNRKAEKEKLVKNELEMPKTAPIVLDYSKQKNEKPRVIDYSKFKSPINFKSWKQKWDQKSPDEKNEFRQKLLQVKASLNKADDEGKMHADDDSHMAYQQLQSVFHHLMEIKDNFDPKKDLPDWLDAKITIAAEKLATVAHYMEAFEQRDSMEKTLKINPKLLDDKASHALNGQKVKSVKQDGEDHVVEIMEGKDKGKWMQAKMKQFKELAKAGRCWDGYKPVKGKKPYSKGSCEKIEKAKDIHLLD
jgi:hypothetical protein